MHLMAVAILDPTDVPGGFTAATIKALIEARIDTLPPFRRRVVRVPFGLHHPLWIEDPGFDLDFHVRQVAVPAPGGPHELAAFVGEVAGWPLDRDRPLWQMWVVEGLEHGHVALVAKVHHAAIDGASGVEVLASLVDLEPTPVPAATGSDESWEADRVPSDVEMIGASMLSIARQPLRMARAVVHLGTSLARLGTRLRNETVHAGVPFTAPRLAWNVMITPHRQVAFSAISLEDVKVVKDVYGATVNDVVLAVLSGAFRRYFVARDELPDRPLVAVIPTSVRSMDEKQMGNRVSAMFTQLSTDLEDPLDRLAAVQDTMSGAKQVHSDIGGNTLEEWAELAAPAMLSRGARLYSQLRLADRHPPVHNLVVSNVPGPQFPLYMAGVAPRRHVPHGAGVRRRGPERDRDELPGPRRHRVHGLPGGGAGPVEARGRGARGARRAREARARRRTRGVTPPGRPGGGPHQVPKSQVSSVRGASPRRMNHSWPKASRNASGGSWRKNESSGIWLACACIAPRFWST